MSIEWYSNFENFKNWSIQNGYTEDKNLFRKNTLLGYFTDNCQWAKKSFEVRVGKGRKKAYCKTCQAEVARSGSNCRKCSAILLRKNINFDRKAYARNWALEKKYGITLTDFNEMLINQKGKCKICKKEMEEPSIGQGQNLNAMALDHCHKTKKVRSILCNGCNKGLGLFHDDPILLENALAYIKENT